MTTILWGGASLQGDPFDRPMTTARSVIGVQQLGFIRVFQAEKPFSGGVFCLEITKVFAIMDHLAVSQCDLFPIGDLQHVLWMKKKMAVQSYVSNVRFSYHIQCVYGIKQVCLPVEGGCLCCLCPWLSFVFQVCCCSLSSTTGTFGRLQ